MTGFGSTLLKYARVVRAHSPLLAAQVRDGSTTLNEAYEEVRAKQKAAESDDEKRARLASEAPDLALLVKEERMKLSEAAAAHEQRKSEARRHSDRGGRGR